MSTTTVCLIDINDIFATEPRAPIEPLVRSITLDGLRDPIQVCRAGKFWRVTHGVRRYWALRNLWLRGAVVYDTQRNSMALAQTLYAQIPCEIVE